MKIFGVWRDITVFMDKLKIDLEYCYGIKKLSKEFDFSDKRTFAIYAPNGVMKTSFAKTFLDLSNGLTSKDLIFPARTTIRSIKTDGGSDLTGEQVFVMEPYNEGFSSEKKMSTLLVNKTLKKQYDDIHLKINEEKDRLLKELRLLSGLREDDIEEEISQAFFHEPNKMFDSFERIEKEVLNESEPAYSEISYKTIFNEKVIAFLGTKEVKTKLSAYIDKYGELIDASKYFRKGIFNHNNASAIAKSLMENGFFQADHTVHLNTKDKKDLAKNEIHSKDELEKIIKEEMQTILSNPELSKAFEEIDKQLRKNQELRDFREYIIKNTKILAELGNLESFRQKIWISYLKSQKSLFESLINEYHIGAKELKGISEKAKTEATLWRTVIDTFNKRFYVPFTLKVQNQADVILKRVVPVIAFDFKDEGKVVPVEKKDLLLALSSGEKRALYILNIIFEVEARKEERQETLFVVDDIADSFDYKNKYAIIEYLRDISMERGFYQLILTHNFDFFRTISSRFVSYGHCLMVEKTSEGIKINGANYINNPFIRDWVRHLDDNKKLIASIPFVRNLVEYTLGDQDDKYNKLTSLLHIKAGSSSIQKKEVFSIFKEVIPTITVSILDGDKNVLELIFELADACLDARECMGLENKILLSIAIRLKAEQLMFARLTDKAEVESNQTKMLIQRYKDEYKDKTPEKELIELFERVNLMTPENIHFNSFMYEPILDMSDEHLRRLYREIRAVA
jgi:hypothetical protein